MCFQDKKKTFQLHTSYYINILTIYIYIYILVRDKLNKNRIRFIKE